MHLSNFPECRIDQTPPSIIVSLSAISNMASSAFAREFVHGASLRKATVWGTICAQPASKASSSQAKRPAQGRAGGNAALMRPARKLLAIGVIPDCGGDQDDGTQPNPDIAPAGAVWMSCAIAWTSSSVMAATRARAIAGSMPWAWSWAVVSARSSTLSTIARSTGGAGGCAVGADHPALAVWNDKASSDTTSARQVIFFIVDCIFRLLGWVAVLAAPAATPTMRAESIYAGRRACGYAVSVCALPHKPRKK